MNQQRLIKAAEDVRSYYMIITEDIPYEIKGIFFSELLMVMAIINKLQPNYIIESGRARGQSTLVLARMMKLFDYCEFHSVESNKSNEDADIAEARLKEEAVNLHYGDSFEVIPKLINDII